MSEIIIDAKGLSCPEPVLLTQSALKNYANQALSIEVNSAVARDNVVDILEKNKRMFNIEEHRDFIRIMVKE